MPVYVRKNLLSITPASLSYVSSDEEDYIRNPEHIYDALPQPFRLVNKIVNLIFDLSWELISERETVRSAEKHRHKPPVYDCAVPLPVRFPLGVGHSSKLGHEFDYSAAQCMIGSPDGRYVFFGLPSGIAVIDAASHALITLWSHGTENAAICALNVCIISGQTYLLTALDTSGSCKLLLCAYEAIHPIKTFNEDQTGSLVTNTFLSSNGDYVAVMLQCGRDEWLGVWHLPSNNWLHEIETAHNNAMKQQQQLQQHTVKQAEIEKQESAIEMATSVEGIAQDSTAKHPSTASPRSSPTPHHPAGGSSPAVPSLNLSQMSKPVAVLRVRPPPAKLTGSNLRAVDDGGVVGLGFKQHLITDQHLEKRRLVFRHQQADQMRFCPQQEDAYSYRPLCAFLNPSYPLVTGLETSNDKPNSVAVAWTGTTNVCHYNLLKQAKDLEHKPDIVWPFGSEVTCLAASSCSSILAVGLRDGTVATYDQHLGFPISLERLSMTGGPTAIHFLPPASPPRATASLQQSHFISSSLPTAVQFVVHCTDGSVSVVGCGNGTSHVRVIEESCDLHIAEKVVLFQPLTATSQVVSASGKMSLIDVHSGRVLCIMKLPPATDDDECSFKTIIPPILTSAGSAYKLYIKGVKRVTDDSADQNPTDSCVFVFPMGSFPALKPLTKMTTVSKPFGRPGLAQKRFDQILAQRLNLQNDRQTRMQKHWDTLRPQVIPCE